MSDNQLPGFSDRYRPWRDDSSFQRRVLHICSITVVVIVLAITFDWFRDLLLWPFETAHRWMVGPPAYPYATTPTEPGGSYIESHGVLDVVLGAAVVGTVVGLTVSAVYALTVLMLRAVRQWRTHRPSPPLSEPSDDVASGQPN